MQSNTPQLAKVAMLIAELYIAYSLFLCWMGIKFHWNSDYNITLNAYTVKSINLNFAVQFWSLYTWDISNSRHRHLKNGHSCGHSTQDECNPIWMIRCQCTSPRQAILGQFLHHSKLWSLSRSLQWNPTDDRQRHSQYHAKGNHRQYPSQRKDDIFRFSLFCCYSYLPISSVGPT